MDYLLCCNNCGDVIVKDSGDETKSRGKLLVLKSNKAYSVCRGCGAEVEVPIQRDEELFKSLRTSPRLYIGKKRI